MSCNQSPMLGDMTKVSCLLAFETNFLKNTNRTACLLKKIKTRPSVSDERLFLGTGIHRNPIVGGYAYYL